MLKPSIIATYGPSLYDYSTLLKAVKSGVSVIRFNFSHSDLDIFDKALNQINKLKKEGFKIKTMADLKGNRIRVRNITNPIPLYPGNNLVLTARNVKSSDKIISFDYAYSLNEIKKGTKIYIDDGNIELEAVRLKSKNDIETKVKRGGFLKNKKGVNIPGVNLYFPLISEEDIKDMEYITNKDFDMIAFSFVRTAGEIKEAKKIIKQKNKKIPILISKIENDKAVRNLKSIIKFSDGLMVARGDLGISVPLYRVPFLQKKIIKETKKAGKFSIVATQIFESMIENYRPTRAEVSDLANAVEDGADYVMFSAETAVGKFPLETIQTALEIIKYSKKYLKNGI